MNNHEILRWACTGTAPPAGVARAALIAMTSISVSMAHLPAAQAAIPEPPASVLAQEAELIVTGWGGNIDARVEEPDWVAGGVEVSAVQPAQIRGTCYTTTIRIQAVEKGGVGR